MGTTVSVINYKGGVGKTTLTANIAAELAHRGKRVLVIDLDPQTNLTFSFVSVDQWQQIYQSGLTIKAWYDAFIDGDHIGSLADLLIQPPELNHLPLHIIASHLGLINVDLELAVMLGGASVRQQRNNFLRVHSLLAKGLDSLKEEYDLILIDCPPNFNVVTKNALVASDYFLIPAKPDYLSTLGIQQLIRHVEELIADYNKFITDDDTEYRRILPELLGIAFTMIAVRDGSPITAQQQYIEQVRRRGLPVFECHTRENKTLFASASEYGVPVVLQSVPNGTHRTVQEEFEKLTDEFALKVGL
jgi:chromosome partitioning protein